MHRPCQGAQPPNGRRLGQLAAIDQIDGIANVTVA
jgi:hypothetical protein